MILFYAHFPHKKGNKVTRAVTVFVTTYAFENIEQKANGNKVTAYDMPPVMRARAYRTMLLPCYPVTISCKLLIIKEKDGNKNGNNLQKAVTFCLFLGCFQRVSLFGHKKRGVYA